MTDLVVAAGGDGGADGSCVVSVLVSNLEPSVLSDSPPRLEMLEYSPSLAAAVHGSDVSLGGLHEVGADLSLCLPTKGEWKYLGGDKVAILASEREGNSSCRVTSPSTVMATNNTGHGLNIQVEIC